MVWKGYGMLACVCLRLCVSGKKRGGRMIYVRQNTKLKAEEGTFFFFFYFCFVLF